MYCDRMCERLFSKTASSTRQNRQVQDMAKLYFRYGAMGSSKTANALMVRYNYIEKGQTPILLKPRTDTRDGERVIRSRIGLAEKCLFVDEFLSEMAIMLVAL